MGRLQWLVGRDILFDYLPHMPQLQRLHLFKDSRWQAMPIVWLLNILRHLHVLQQLTLQSLRRWGVGSWPVR